MSTEFASVLIFVVLAALFPLVTLAIGRLIRPAAPNAVKNDSYECGEHATGGGWFNFNPRFYVVALVFLIFDVEVAFTYPVATVFQRWVSRGHGGVALLELALFVAVLALGLIYVWRRRDLDWLRSPRE